MRFTQFLVGALMVMTASFAAAETNIAILNVQGVVLGSNMANDFKAELQREFKPREDSLNAMAEELRKMQEDGARDAEFMSDEQKRELTQKYGTRLREFQKMQNDMSRDQAEREKAFVESVRPKLDAVVNRIVEARDIDLLIDRRMVLFSKGAANLDISQEALDALNATK